MKSSDCIIHEYINLTILRLSFVYIIVDLVRPNNVNNKKCRTLVRLIFDLSTVLLESWYFITTYNLWQYAGLFITAILVPSLVSCYWSTPPAPSPEILEVKKQFYQKYILKTNPCATISVPRSALKVPSHNLFCSFISSPFSPLIVTCFNNNIEGSF